MNTESRKEALVRAQNNGLDVIMVVSLVVDKAVKDITKWTSVRICASEHMQDSEYPLITGIR